MPKCLDQIQVSLSYICKENESEWNLNVVYGVFKHPYQIVDVRSVPSLSLFPLPNPEAPPTKIGL